MQRKLYSIYLILTLLLAPLDISAQQVKIKNYRDAKTYLKNNKKAEVDKIVAKLAPADSVEKHYLNGMINLYNYEKQNVNLYWKSKVDTASVFKNLYTMYEQFDAAYPYVLDSYAKPVAQVYQTYQNNLRIGGNYFITQNDYPQAYKFYSIFLKLQNDKLITPADSVISSVYGNAVIAAFRANRLDDVVRLGNLAHQKGYDSMDIDLQLCEALRKMNRTEEWVAALKTAIEHHPNQFVFYGVLIDYYLKENRVEAAMLLADDLIKKDADNYLNCFVKGYVCQHTEDVDCALEWLKKAVDKQAEYIPALSSLGYSIIKKAEKTEDSIDHFPFTAGEKETINSIYKEAQIVLEKTRQLDPMHKEHWATGLWKVYYKLNEGEKLDEIEKVIG